MGEFEGFILCACSDGEKALRAYGRGVALAPMAQAERDWCLSEIGRVEGHDPETHRLDTDADLARGVLCAWTDFCRDKGLIR